MNIVREILDGASSIGEPASKFTPRIHRFVPAVVAVQNNSNRVVEQIREGRTADPKEAFDVLDKGRMPRSAGIVYLGRRGVYGSIDLQAVQQNTEALHLLPEAKKSVNPETKEVTQEGIVAFTKFVVASSTEGSGLFASIQGVQLVGEAFNPDLEPWKADLYSQTQRIFQNNSGMAIGLFDYLELAHMGNLPASCDPRRGTTTLQLRSLR